MEDFFLVVLFVAVVWLLVRQSYLGEAMSRIDELTGVIRGLEARLAAMERARKSPVPHSIPEAQTAAPPEAKPAREEEIPRVVATVAGYPLLRAYQASLPDVAPPPPRAIVAESVTPPPEPPPEPPPTPPRPRLSLEERLGRNWLNKLGIVTLVIGLALFLGYQLRTLGPLGKSLLGLALSGLLLAGGIFLERRETYRIFARAAIGGGWALTFFVTFALYHVDAMQILHSQTIDLILMLVVAAAMVGHSLLYQSQAVTGLAFSLAFVTVGISHVTLFSWSPEPCWPPGSSSSPPANAGSSLVLRASSASTSITIFGFRGCCRTAGGPEFLFPTSSPAPAFYSFTGCSSDSFSFSASRLAAARSCSRRSPRSSTRLACCCC